MSKLEQLIQELCPDGVEYKPLFRITNLTAGDRIIKSMMEDNMEYPVYGGGVYPTGKYNEYNFEYSITISRAGSAGHINWVEGKFWATDVCFVASQKEENVNIKFVYYYLKNKEDELKTKIYGGNLPKLNKDYLWNLPVPLPPLEIQSEIARILDHFTLLTAELTAELTARKNQYEYYKNQVFETLDAKFIKLGDIGRVKMCKRILKSQTNTTSGIPFYKIGTFGGTADAFISEETYSNYISKYSYPKKGDILISCAGTIGRTVVYDGQPAYFQDSNIVWLEHDESIVLNKYLIHCYSRKPWNISTGGTIARLYNDNILKAEIPVPSLEEQEKIVNILERFDKLCNDISEGLPAEIEARQKQYEYYRNKLLTFKELKKEN